MLRIVPFDSVVMPATGSVLFDRVQRRRRPSSNPIAPLDGLWKGHLYDGDERRLPFAILNSVPETGSMLSRISFSIPKPNVVALDLLEASSFAYVVVSEPYTDPSSGRLVLTSLEGRWARNRLWGAYLTRPLEGGHATIGRFSAVRSEIAGW